MDATKLAESNRPQRRDPTRMAIPDHRARRMAEGVLGFHPHADLFNPMQAPRFGYDFHSDHSRLLRLKAGH
jgi:hypothetical protein